MSTFGVFAHELIIEEHPNADAIEIARIGGYQAIVGKGQFKTGDRALYIPEQAIVPEWLLEHMGLVGKLAGKEHNRVKAIKLRGVISQGLVWNPLTWDQYEPEGVYAAYRQPDYDWSETLGITKWVPEIPAHFAGDVEACGWMVPMYEIDNIKGQMDLFEEGEEILITEKIHGTCCIMGYDAEADQFVVSSKGLAKQHLSLKEDEKNVYWRMARKYNIEEMCRGLAEAGCTRVFFYGEVFGTGIQDLTYGVPGGDPQLRVFGAWYKNPSATVLLGRDHSNLHEGCFVPPWGIPDPLLKAELVPELYRGKYDYELITKIAEGTTKLDGEHIREGVVVTAWEYGDYGITRTELGDKKVAKFINPDYLLRKGNVTEYE